MCVRNDRGLTVEAGAELGKQRLDLICRSDAERGKVFFDGIRHGVVFSLHPIGTALTPEARETQYYAHSPGDGSTWLGIKPRSCLPGLLDSAKGTEPPLGMTEKPNARSWLRNCFHPEVHGTQTPRFGPARSTGPPLGMFGLLVKPFLWLAWKTAWEQRLWPAPRRARSRLGP